MMKFRKIQTVRLVTAGLCILTVGVLACINAHLCGILPSQQAGERWQDDGKASQISVFLRPEADFSTENITSLHETIDTELTAKSIQAENKSARRWYDAYSTQIGQTEVTGNRKSPSDALVTVVGGDFFQIHAPELLSGGYFSEQDIMHDRVVIDVQLAWNLFGSADVAGMELTVQNQKCLVAGVIQPETDSASRMAYGTMPRIYISYDFYQKNWNPETCHISCYEAVLPNPVRNFAKELLVKEMNLDEEGNSVVLENTGRYSLSGRWNTLRHLKSLVVCETVTFPYWENSARIIAFDTAVLLLMEIIFSIWPVIYFLYLIRKGYIFAEKTISQKRLAWKNRYRSEIKQI
ncbi:MAG: ABC transporter permease [Ruminococcus sp.]|nr:ABC transporter permease [Ruminococcus sp.]